MPPQTHDIFDIEDALVTPENPALDSYTLDYTRCARLHNYLVAYLWSAQHDWETPSSTELQAACRKSLGEEHNLGEEYEQQRSAIRSRLHPSLNHFIDLVYEPGKQFFYFVHDLSMELADEWILELYDEYNLEERGLERFVIIYGTVVDLGSHCVGLLYDQELHRATLTLVQENTDSVFPISEHWNMWVPLETILSHWIELVKMKKVIAHEDEGSTPDEERMSRSQIGPWSWLSYCEKQVIDTVSAIDSYTAAIESRIPNNSLLDISRDEPLFTHADLDAASIPTECFIRSVLTKIKTPRFKMIAPGLAVPHDKQAFITRQKFTKLPPSQYHGELVPPVLIFASEDSSRNVPFNEELRHLFCKTRLWEETPFKEGDPVFTGLYSEPTEREAHDNEEGGFRLFLPFAFRADYRDGGARKSDGSHVSAGSFTELFQNGGYYAFGGEHRSQRLERLVKRWEEMIESGVWSVGVDGVEGDIDLFRDADRGAWRDYWIAPSW
ncbi:hypothetical protein N7456_012106 [Penicillium angulare]|uniref:Uncharacterized protein n=1 Tax=Penicillium angulare TaxID=116970 RepID=A0A9W9EV83_9EURO|nr:hypothetical protein N7456_012106 [Penicillium angulare]